MRTYNRDLRRARLWLAAGRSSKVIQYLEPKVPLFLEDPVYYALLGRACLYAGLLKDAEIYLSRGLQADSANLDVRLTLAATHLKRKDPAAAVRTWLEILEDQPQQKNARRGLKRLKRISDQEAQDRFLENCDPRPYLPDIRSRWTPRIITGLSVILLALTALYFRDAIKGVLTPRTPRMRGDASAVLQNPSLPGNPVSAAEAKRLLRRALRHYQQYRDNSARYELNRVLHLSAHEETQRQAADLIALLRESDMESLETDFTYKQVKEEPQLYQGCWVLWTGMTANVRYEDDAVLFDLLVGFQDGQILEGRVPVRVAFPVLMEPLPLEILARVEIDQGDFTLVGKTLHFLR